VRPPKNDRQVRTERKKNLVWLTKIKREVLAGRRRKEVVKVQMSTSSEVLHDGACHKIDMPRGATVGAIGGELEKLTGTFLGCCRLFHDGRMMSLSEKVLSPLCLVSVRTENPYELRKVAFDTYSDPLTREIIFGVREERVDDADDDDIDVEDADYFQFFEDGVRAGEYACTLDAMMISYPDHFLEWASGKPYEGMRFQCREALLVGVHGIHFDVELRADPHNRFGLWNPPTIGDAVSVGVCLADGSNVTTPLTVPAYSPLFGDSSTHRNIVRVVCTLDTTCTPPTFTAAACLRCDVDNVQVQVQGQVKVGGQVHGSADVAVDTANDGFRWFVRCYGSVIVAPCATSWSEWVE
jgi:hypothetical protein